VYVNDQLTGKTSRRGDLFVDDLGANQNATIRIEGADVPIERGVDQLVQTVAPRGRGAFVLRFASGRRSLIAHLDPPANQPFAGGLQAVDTATRRPYPLGDDGLLYVEDVTTDRLTVHVERDVAPCTATLNIPPGNAGVIDLGRVPCR
jgi:outer membrane usher protein FimD/PapC